MTCRDSFVERFGEDEALAVEGAYAEHRSKDTSVGDQPEGSDPFRSAICVCIGFECMSKDRYRKHHGVTAPWEEIRAWIKSDANLHDHDGPKDYMAMLAGVYNEFMPDKTEVAE